MSVSAIPWDEVTTSKFEGVKRDFVVPERFQDSSSLLTDDDAQQLDRLVQEIHHCKVNNAALREKITSRRVMLDERSQLLNVLQRNLEDIKSENEKLATVLGHGRGP